MTEAQHPHNHHTFLFVLAVFVLLISALLFMISSGITGFVVYGNGTSCNESWAEQYTECGIDDTKLKYYIDANNCDQGEGMPAGNGTAESCDYCTPSPVRMNGTCNALNTMVISSVDENSCYNATGLAADLVDANVASSACDYCVPSWQAFEDACLINDTKTVTYAYNNACCADTGLSSDCTIPTTKTDVPCDYCNPDWDRQETDCIRDEYTIYYTDSRNCFDTTGLDSDLEGRLLNQTVSCDFCVPEWIPVSGPCVDGVLSTFFYDMQACNEPESAPPNTTLSCGSKPASLASGPEQPVAAGPGPESGNESAGEIVGGEPAAKEQEAAPAEVLASASLEDADSAKNSGGNERGKLSLTGQVVSSLFSGTPRLASYLIAFVILLCGFAAFIIHSYHGHRLEKVWPFRRKYEAAARHYFTDVEREVGILQQQRDESGKGRKAGVQQPVPVSEDGNDKSAKSNKSAKSADAGQPAGQHPAQAGRNEKSSEKSKNIKSKGPSSKPSRR